jgi:hypothetical protein
VVSHYQWFTFSFLVHGPLVEMAREVKKCGQS